MTGGELEVRFFDAAEDKLLKFAVILSRYHGKWVLCKHRERNTYEMPGGHREADETIFETAVRELYEETGALQFDIGPVCAYSVTGRNRVNQTGEETYGMLFFADIHAFAGSLHSEMELVAFFDTLPAELTYPHIQPLLLAEYGRRERGCLSGALKAIRIC